MRSAVLIVIVLAAGAAVAAAPADSPAAERTACELLAPDDVRAVQGATVKELKPSEHKGQGLRFAQCVFATTEFARSVSLSVITGGGDAAVQRYWQETFHPRATRASRKSPPRAMEGTGDEAFWSGDARAGSLYVLRGGAILRISVGGVGDEDERIRRSQALARAALRRLSSGR